MAKEDLAYRSIIRMILNNQFKPGDFLLETELAGELNLSRTPVRHALGRLVAEGFLEKRSKKGCLIPLPTPEDAMQVFLVREAIESQAAALAARFATGADIEELRSLLRTERETHASFDREAYALANEQFHLSIVRISRNTYLELYCRHVFWRSNLYIFFFDSYYVQKETDDRLHLTHADIVEAIANRDAESAEAGMRQHIRRTYDMLFIPWKK